MKKIDMKKTDAIDYILILLILLLCPLAILRDIIWNGWNNNITLVFAICIISYTIIYFVFLKRTQKTVTLIYAVCLAGYCCYEGLIKMYDEWNVVFPAVIQCICMCLYERKYEIEDGRNNKEIAKRTKIICAVNIISIGILLYVTAKTINASL